MKNVLSDFLAIFCDYVWNIYYLKVFSAGIESVDGGGGHVWDRGNFIHEILVIIFLFGWNPDIRAFKCDVKFIAEGP